jgi:hypothetical protein
MAATQGPNVLFCTPNYRTNCVPLVSVNPPLVRRADFRALLEADALQGDACARLHPAGSEHSAAILRRAAAVQLRCPGGRIGKGLSFRCGSVALQRSVCLSVCLSGADAAPAPRNEMCNFFSDAFGPGAKGDSSSNVTLCSQLSLASLPVLDLWAHLVHRAFFLVSRSTFRGRLSMARCTSTLLDGAGGTEPPVLGCSAP